VTQRPRLRETVPSLNRSGRYAPTSWKVAALSGDVALEGEATERRERGTAPVTPRG
jgi:hypothetical protein